MMTATRNYFPFARIDDGTAEEYAGEWVDLVKRFGLERFEQGLAIARKFKLEAGVTVPRQWFPLPSEIEEFIETQTYSPTYAKTDDNCEHCRGTGFEYTGTGRDVKRCRCRRIVKR